MGGEKNLLHFLKNWVVYQISLSFYGRGNKFFPQTFIFFLQKKICQHLSACWFFLDPFCLISDLNHDFASDVRPPFANYKLHQEPDGARVPLYEGGLGHPSLTITTSCSPAPPPPAPSRRLWFHDGAPLHATGREPGAHRHLEEERADIRLRHDAEEQVREENSAAHHLLQSNPLKWKCRMSFPN